MALSGSNFIGSQPSSEGHRTFHAMNPQTAKPIEPLIYEATVEEIDAAARLADAAFAQLRERGPGDRAKFLNAAAAELDSIGGELAGQITAETALPAARVATELARTTKQLRMFAALIEDGSWVDARIDHGDPARAPVPKPDLRRMLVALGPVAVFGASNFPLAYSVAGGDTASALAAGCPVIVKAHPSHPLTSERVMRAMLAAAATTNMPEGIISMVHGYDPQVSLHLVSHPLVKAVGFTGSLRAGRALMDAAAARMVPIPVFAEMGSVNPVFILPGALKGGAEAIAAQLCTAVTNGVGQFCTKPGVVVMIDDATAKEFVQDMSRRLDAVPDGTMLNANIAHAYHHGRRLLNEMEGVKRLTAGRVEGSMDQASPALFVTNAARFLSNPAMRQELFGPATLMVAAKDVDQMRQVAESFDGQLTATIHAAPEEMGQSRELIEALKQKAGRLVFNGFPTGVEVNASMQHGGPYPATSDSRSTSVGTAAILRFARPLAFQNWPDELLPVELQEGNPRKIWRSVDGKAMG
jgi:NADP-dependent aldehyde dehydrogenase